MSTDRLVWARAVLRKVARTVTNPALVVPCLVLGAAAQLVAGIALLAGLAWALLAGAATSALVALLIARGVR